MSESKCDRYGDIAVNAARILALQEGQKEIKSGLTRMDDKLDKLSIGHAKLVGLVTGSGILGGAAGGVASTQLAAAVVPGAQVQGVADIVSFFVGGSLIGAGVLLYKYIMRKRVSEAYPVPPPRTHAPEIRQERYRGRKDARLRQLAFDLRQTPTDLEDLLAEAEGLSPLNSPEQD